MSGTTLQNLYIGSPFGKKHEFILDDITITDLTPSSCTGPSITAFSNSEGHTYNLGDAATTMSVTATAGDGGALSYKWYQYDDGQDPTTQAVEAAGTNNAASYTPSTASAYTDRHFFCVVSEAGCSTTAKSAYSGAISVTAPTYSVTVNVNDASYGSASAASTTVSQGSTTTITATPNSGYQFDHWTVSGTGASLSSATDNPTTLTMGTTSVTVTAYFVEATCPTSGTLYTLEMKSGQSYSVPASTETNLVSTYATVSGGGAYIGNIGSSDGKAQVRTDGSGTVYFNGADAYIKIVLDCPLQTGDSLYFTNGSGSNQICFTTTTTRSTTYATTSNKYEFPAAFDGISTIYIWRFSSSSTYVHTINILRPAAKADATVFAFSSGTFNDWGSCNGGTLTLAGSQSGVNYQLYKDGVASGSPVAGTGSALNFTVTTSGTYTVKSVANATYAETAMTGSAVVTIQDPTLSGPSSVAIGSTITLTHPNHTAGGDNWVSSNTSVATVSTAGVVTGVSAGTATITFHGVGSCDGTKEITVYDGSVTYSVTYNGNGSTSGSVPVDANSPYAANATVTVLGNTGSLEKTDYSFSGWNTAADGSGTSYAAGATFTITANTTLYAQWIAGCDEQTLSKVVLTSASAGTVTGYNGNEYAGSAVIGGLGSGQAATINGQSVTGYKLNSSGTAILFATLAKGTFQVGDKVKITITKINDNYEYPEIGAKTGMDIYYGTNKDDAALLTTLSDVTVAGVYEYELTAADVTTIGNKKGIGVFRASSRAQNHYVYSVEITGCRDWTTYNVTYNGNGNDGGAVPTDANSYLYNATATVLGNTGSLTKSLYRFNGWNTSADGSGTSYAAGATFNIQANTTLYAQWIPDCDDPTVVVQPTNKSIFVGETTILSCEGNKVSNTYQWFNATENTAAGTGAEGTPVSVGSGYNAAGWTTPAISATGTYQYYCVIYDGLCSVETNIVTITVTDPPINPTAVTLADINIEVGESVQLIPGYVPANANQNLTASSYTTASSDIAMVTNTGMLTGVAVGKTTVTVTLVYNGLTATANVLVRPATIPCETWEETPTLSSNATITINSSLKLTSSGMSTSASQVVYYEGSTKIQKTALNFSSQGKYLEGCFEGGYDISSISIGCATNQDASSGKFVLVYSPTKDFAVSSVTILEPTAPNRKGSRDIQTFNVPTGIKYFRIYRNTKDFGSTTYGESTTVNVYYLQVCPVTPCTEKAGTIAITSGSAQDCPGSSRTLTISGYEAGADIQWYKDGVFINGATSASLSTTEPGDYYAVTTNVCEKRSTNSITLTNTPDPSAAALLEYIYVKNGRPVDIDLFEFDGATSWTVTPAISGCTYTEVNGKIHLSGTPVIAANSNTTMTLTVTNSCGAGSTATATLDLHLLAATAKPTLAYVVTGTKNGDWTAANSEGTALSTYLSTYYTVTVVNGYATNNEARIKAYYSQFDVVLVTDYPDTNTGPNSGTEGAGGRSYTNAIGCLIDIKPILTLETFVSKLDNWQISSDPKNTSSVRKMKVLCTSHNIFDSTLFEGTDQDEITILSGGTMQGFEPTLAPNYMFIATIDNGGETLVNCCERQIKVGARMILLGIQHEAMGSITDKGKTVIHNIIEYLLLTDPNGMADCSIVFDDDNGTHIWSDAANWGPAHNKIPTPYQKVRIEKPCTVDITSAAASSLTLRKDNGNNANGSITINANASLSVIGTIREVRGTDYITTYPVSAEDLVVKSNASNQGALAQGDEDGLTHATVQFYARGINSPSTDTQWQYMGTPFSDVAHAVDHYENSWMCRWNEDTEGFSDTNWEWVRNDDAVVPFVGYALSQTNSKTFTLTGTLVPSTEKTIRLTASSPTEWSGWNLLANSWMAPINISQFETSDFGSAEATIYVMNTGKNDGNQSASGSESSTAGQYVAIPIASAGSMAATAQQIPPMQGFYVLTAAATTLTLDYNKLIYTSTFTNTTYPNRAPRRMSAAEDDEEVLTNTVMPRLIIDVDGSRYSDRLYLFENAELTHGFDNAWDGRKWEGDYRAPQLMTRTDNLDLAVDASPSFDHKQIAFRAGEDQEYILRFSTDIVGLRFRDLLTGAEMNITDGGEYLFTATNTESEVRFEIGDSRQIVDVPTSEDQLDHFSDEVLAVDVFTPDGRFVLHRTTNFNEPLLLPQSGIYIIRLQTTAGVKVQKITIQ